MKEDTLSCLQMILIFGIILEYTHIMLSMPSKRTTPEPVKNKWSPSVKLLRLEIPYLLFFLVKFILIVKLSRLFWCDLSIFILVDIKTSLLLLTPHEDNYNFLFSILSISAILTVKIIWLLVLALYGRFQTEQDTSMLLIHLCIQWSLELVKMVIFKFHTLLLK